MTTPSSPLYSIKPEEHHDDDTSSSNWQSHAYDDTDYSLSQDQSAPESNLTKDPKTLQKRRRVTRACDECRRKKIKCDGVYPCSHCTVYSYGKNCFVSPLTYYFLTCNRNAECTYDQPSNRRRNPPPQYVEALEARLHKAEALLKVVLPDLDLDDPQFDVHATEQLLAAIKKDKPPSGSGRRPSAVMPPDAGAEGGDESLLESMVDNAGCLDLDDQGHWDYHGHTSGIIFMRRLRKQLGASEIQLPTRSRPLPQVVLESPKSAADSPHDSTLPPTHDLPSRAVARRLCHNALDDGCSLMRFVHEPSFYAMFDRIYDTPPEQFTNEENSFLPLLYIVISVGCLFSDGGAGSLDLSGYESAIGQGYVASSYLRTCY